MDAVAELQPYINWLRTDGYPMTAMSACSFSSKEKSGCKAEDVRFRFSLSEVNFDSLQDIACGKLALDPDSLI